MSTHSIEHYRHGLLYRQGLLTDDQLSQCVDWIRELNTNGIQTVRVVFADQHGVLRGKTLVLDAIDSLFLSGITVPSTLLLKDTSHATVFPVWSGSDDAGLSSLKGAGDIRLVPDIATAHTLPWLDNTAWILCDVVYADCRPVEFASRTVLKRAISRLSDCGFSLICGLEIEFHVYQAERQCLLHEEAGMPASAPPTVLLAPGYQLLTETHADRMHTVLELLRENCQKLGLPLRTMELEFGPGQCEFTFAPGTALEQADNLMLFRSLVKQVCFRHGLVASFMCRPVYPNAASSGWHIHQSLVDNQGSNVFTPSSESPDDVPAVAGRWIAGLLQHAPASCLLTTPTVNGYKRYRKYQLAPSQVVWARDNKGAMIRALLQHRDAASRIENRVAEPGANPYYCLASQLLSGESGIKSALTAPPAVEDPYDADSIQLPGNLLDAVRAFENDTLYKDTLGDEFVRYMSQLKRAEWLRYQQVVTDWEQSEYFMLL